MSNTNAILLTAQRLMKRRQMGKSLTGKDLGKGITQRKDGLYQGSVVKDGKRLTVYDRNLSVLKKKLGDVRTRQVRKETDMTLDIWYDKWIRVCKSNIRDTTRRTYKNSYGPIKPYLGGRRLTDIRKVDVQEALNNLDTKSKRRMAKGVLCDMFECAVENDLIEKNPAKGVYVERGGNEERKVLSDEEIKLILKELNGNPYMYDITVLALHTGMRIGEILGLKKEDIDFEKKLITVQRTLVFVPGKGPQEHYPKTSSGKRDIPMIAVVAKMLRRRLSDTDLIFATRNGTPLGDSNVRALYRKAFRKIEAENPGVDLKGVTPHTFRHTFATNCIANGMKPKVLQKILGHATLQMTMDLYCHVREETAIDEMEKCCKNVVEL